MPIKRKFRLLLAILAGIVILGLGYFLLTAYITHRVMESDMLWVGTKSVGMRLLIYAQDHGGQYPVTLEDGDFAKTLDTEDNIYLRHMRPEYRQPVGDATNVAKLLIAHSKRQTVVFYSDGNMEGR